MKMLQIRSFAGRTTPILASALFIFALTGCSIFEGDEGDPGPAGPQGAAGDPGGPGPSIGPVTSLTMEGDSASVGITPVINFTVKNQNGQGYAGLVPNDLRFTIAKLVPAPAAGMPSNWQNYIVTTQTSTAAGAPGAGREMVQGTRETPAGSADPSAGPPFPPGTLVNYGDGTYTYTFATDITNVACPAPCRDAWGRALDLSFNASLTHRVGVQTRGSNAPMVNLAYDFVPAGGAVTTQREIVKTAKCNECHNELELHDERIETRYCVTCHNRGSTDPDGERPAKDAPAMQPAYVLASGAVDFKQMIHKIHRGEDLPMVGSGEEYVIWGYLNSRHDYSTVVFPQDIRNCTKCHDGADPDTPQGNNWNDVPSIEACGACHDEIIFDAPLGTPDGHPGGPVDLSTNCTNCHSTGLIGKSPAEAHVILGRAEAANYAFVINDVRGDGLTTSPLLEIDVSVVNPNTGVAYDILGGDVVTNPVFKGTEASLRLQISWSTFDSGANVDYNNFVPTVTPGTGYTVSSAPTPAQPLRFDFVDDGVSVTCDGVTVVGGDWICSAGVAGANILTFTKQSVLPGAPLGTGRVHFEGHPALASDPNNEDMRVRSAFKDFAITDTTPIARRDIVDINKCKQCHDILALHGGNRVDEPQVCVTCHNPSLTDISYNNNSNFACAGPSFPDTRARPKVTSDGTINGFIWYPLTSCLDGQTEQAAQFKVLIHGIHAGQRDDPDTPTVEGHGFREKGLQVRRDDFGHVRFPGILSDCETCHLEGTYELEGAWEAPTLNGLQSASMATTPGVNSSNTDPVAYGDTLNNQADDLKISPTAAACAACHDGAVARSHMTALGGAVFGTKTQQEITDDAQGGLTMESCSVCHGPGHLADVEVVHERE